MQIATWMVALGLLLIVVHATSPLVTRLPLSPAILYFLCGVALGPWGLDWLDIDPFRDLDWLEPLAEIAVLVSLFATGSNVGSTLRGRHWSTPIRLATVAMVLTIVAIATIANQFLGMSLGAALIVAAALAPTDPVLAGDVQVADASDRDRLRFGLTGEAGLNDGAAFPFVMLGLGLLSLHDLGTGGWRWWAIDLAWAVGGGLAIGALLGLAAGRWVLYRVRAGNADEGSDAFLGLGLVAIAYGIAVSAHAYGFLAVFAAAVTLQWTVAGPVARAATPSGKNLPAVDDSDRKVAIESLQRFNSELESLCEFGVVIVVGVLFCVVPLTWDALLVAAALFLVIRPASVAVALWRTPLAPDQRVLAGWFGIRGIGSIYYMLYALSHGFAGAEAERMLQIVLGVVAASIFVHGLSVTPLMSLYRRQHDRRRAPRKAASGVASAAAPRSGERKR